MSESAVAKERPGVVRVPRDDEMDVYAVSHTGRVRTENQDHYLLATFHKRIDIIGTSLAEETHRLPMGERRLAYVAMVADGVGGGQGGAEASATAVEAAMRYVNDSLAVYYGADANEADMRELLQAAALRAHDAVRARRVMQGIQGTMATTLTVYMGVWPTYYLLQVGDSRYYVWREGKLRQVTRDQTLAEELIDLGVLARDKAARTPMASVLSSAIGADKTAPVVTRLDADWRHTHLMCTDGLTKHVSDERIAEVLGSMSSAKEGCETLLQDALDAGGSDNVTIIIGRAIRRDQGGEVTG